MTQDGHDEDGRGVAEARRTIGDLEALSQETPHIEITPTVWLQQVVNTRYTVPATHEAGLSQASVGFHAAVRSLPRRRSSTTVHCNLEKLKRSSNRSIRLVK